MTQEEHKKLGIQFFNKTWDLIDKQDKSLEDKLQMMNYAHASRLHWELSGAPILNIVRGEWQVAYVYCLLGMGESALVHAQYCYDETIKNNFGDFDLVFAHQVMAFAHDLLGNVEEYTKYLDLGYNAIDQVEKQGDKDYCKSELDKIKK